MLGLILNLKLCNYTVFEKFINFRIISTRAFDINTILSYVIVLCIDECFEVNQKIFNIIIHLFFRKRLKRMSYIIVELSHNIFKPLIRYPTLESIKELFFISVDIERLSDPRMQFPF